MNEYEKDLENIKQTILDKISFIKKTYPVNGASCFYSIDNGSNYSALTNGELTGVTFAQLKMQETKLVSSITVDAENVVSIKDIYYYYG